MSDVGYMVGQKVTFPFECKFDIFYRPISINSVPFSVQFIEQYPTV